MPFITEEIWQMLPHNGASIMTQSWPHMQEDFIDKKLEHQMELVFEVVKAIRNLRGSIELKQSQKIEVSCFLHQKTHKGLIAENLDLIKSLANAEVINLLDSGKRPEKVISDITKASDIYLHYQGSL